MEKTEEHPLKRIAPCEPEDLMEKDFDDIFNLTPLNEDTTCGLGFIRSSFLQKFANKKAFLILYGITGCIFSATYAYFTGTLTTLEKRYKIPSRNTGIISVGNDITSILLSAVLSYYAGKGHRPRWIAFGLYCGALFCALSALPHLLFGPGEAALSLTKEFGAKIDESMTEELLKFESGKLLCKNNSTQEHSECELEEGSLLPQLILFSAQLIAGVAQTLYFVLGVSYMDDNIKKSKMPALLSISYFFRLLGPAFGYALASYCLKFYISPSLTPTITNLDPRWLGAWWIGWWLLAALVAFFAFFMLLFPKELPRAHVRRLIADERKNVEEMREDEPASIKDMFTTMRRLLKNKTFMVNNIGSCFYFFGMMPYWVFTPKYIETQYKQSASTANLAMGTVAMVFSAIGVLSSGAIISRYKPKARALAMWNVFVNVVTVLMMISYAFMGCSEAENSIIVNHPSSIDLTPTCNSNCNCDYVKYSPVCGEDGNTYISPCHAGCKDDFMKGDEKKVGECSCINPLLSGNLMFSTSKESHQNLKPFLENGSATLGSCKMNCQTEFLTFLTILCLLKFFASSGRASNFLVSLRCVDEKDKSISIGFAETFICLFSFAPSPIFFGALIDYTCIVWGKTCSGTGNCWLYDGEALRYLMNFIAAGFVLIAMFCDIGVWYLVKGLKIFDEETTDIEEVKEQRVKLNNE